MLKENQRILEGPKAVEFYNKLKENDLILYECIVGSQAYGTALPSSDIDKKFIYIEPLERILNQTYSIQLNVNKDYTGFEIGRYLQLLKSQNPNLHEILWQDDETVLTENLLFRILLKNKREKLLTKEIGNTFGKYAETQIKKARGQNKMISQVTSENNPWSTRKTPLDFCFVPLDEKVIPLKEWLQNNDLKQEYCGLVNLSHSKEGFALYYNWRAHALELKEDLDTLLDWFTDIYMLFNYTPSSISIKKQVESLLESEAFKYKGIIQDENSNNISLSSIPKGQKSLTSILYNIDAYQHHCKEYRRVKNWEISRNEERYQNNLDNGAQYDAKNMMHCHRLLDMCIETLETNKILVKRPNREELLEIRAGKYPFEKLVSEADIKIKKIQELLKTSSLPEKLDDDFISNLLLEIRTKYYKKDFSRLY